MYKYLQNLHKFFFGNNIPKLESFIDSKFISYSNELANYYSTNTQKAICKKSLHSFLNNNSSNFWKDEIQFDYHIDKELREQEILRKQIQELIEAYREQYGFEYSELSDQDLIRIAENILIDRDWRYRYGILSSDVDAFKISKKREKYFKRKKARFLKRKRSWLINFREVFRKLYSFHFKNLDDEHDLAITRVQAVI